jgi:predicted  nucleic acid-binding Zn-ribbon protein
VTSRLRVRLGVGIGIRISALALAAVPALAVAQSGVSSNALGGSAPAKGALMTRDELRVCIKEQQAQQSRAAELERRRGEVAAEADAVRRQAGDVQAERDAYQAKVTAAQAFKERVKAHGERVALYNQRLKDFQENPPKGPDAERQRGLLEGEGDAVAKADAAIKVEAAQVTGPLEQARNTLTTHAQAQSAAASAANDHNRQFNDEAKALDDQLSHWRQRCGNRPYRDADERAVRAEK